NISQPQLQTTTIFKQIDDTTSRNVADNKVCACYASHVNFNILMFDTVNYHTHYALLNTEYMFSHISEYYSI
ncbi:unnamed protein product, partial [Schistosoma turkestanicum]